MMDEQNAPASPRLDAERDESSAAGGDFALAQRATPLGHVLATEIADAGRITFERFMRLALSHPKHGYYSRKDLRWGATGDYETAPEVHPVFGYLWARQIEQCWERLGRPERLDLVELGAGSGAFAAAMLGWLREQAPDCAAAVRPVLLDGHLHRIREQRRTLRAHGFEAEHLLLTEWLARPVPVTAVVISNEFFDALPVHLVERRGERWHEWYVGAAPNGGLSLELGPPSTDAIAACFDRLGLLPGDGCRAEVSLAAPELMRRIAARVERGYLLTLDYGYEAAELYAPWRRMGTLMAFRDHSPQPDPLALPGRTDLTAHVDLSSLAAAAADAGFVAAPTTSQAAALVALGLGEALEAAHALAAEDVAAYGAARRAGEALTAPEGLGRIRVLAMAKGAPLEGLRCLEAPAW